MAQTHVKNKCIYCEKEFVPSNERDKYGYLIDKGIDAIYICGVTLVPRYYEKKNDTVRIQHKANPKPKGLICLDCWTVMSG
jgi:hypothetical protein